MAKGPRWSLDQKDNAKIFASNMTYYCHVTSDKIGKKVMI